jgi:hypothetical protein
MDVKPLVVTNEQKILVLFIGNGVSNCYKNLITQRAVPFTSQENYNDFHQRLLAGIVSVHDREMYEQWVSYKIDDDTTRPLNSTDYCTNIEKLLVVYI